MAVNIELTYGKKLGLPEYSSHNFSVSLKTEVANLEDVHEEVSRVYDTLQTAVDEQIVNPGFVPGEHRQPAGGNGTHWKCSDKQRDLILKVISENKLDRNDVEHLAHERFDKGLVLLNKLEASGLIDELLTQNGRGNGRKSTRAYQRAA